MSRSQATIRKAAILVAAVDGRTAELLLSQMDPTEAQAVRRAAAALDVISDAEGEVVLREFCDLATAAACASCVTTSSVVEDRAGTVETKSAGDAGDASVSAADEMHARHAGSDEVSSSPLEEADSARLAELLAQEQPQTIAAFFTRLAPQQAAQVLRTLPAGIQAEVVQRLATTDRPAPSVLREIEQALESRLAQPIRPAVDRSEKVGLKTAARLLDAASYDVRQNVLSSLARRDAALARRLASSPLQPAVDVTA